MNIISMCSMNIFLHMKYLLWVLRLLQVNLMFKKVQKSRANFKFKLLPLVLYGRI